MAAAAMAEPAEIAASVPAKGGRKRLIVLAAPVVLAAVVAGLWFAGLLPSMPGLSAGTEARSEAKADPHGARPAAKAEAAHGARPADPRAPIKPAIPGAPVYADLPDIVANLNAGPRRTVYVKLRSRIELAKAEDEPLVQAAIPRLQDLFQTYLREMRPEELRGSAGTYRLREELIARANIALAPARVQDLLFIEVLIQ